METKLKQLLDTSDSDTFLSKFIRLGLVLMNVTVFVFSSLYGNESFFSSFENHSTYQREGNSAEEDQILY